MTRFKKLAYGMLALSLSSSWAQAQYYYNNPKGPPQPVPGPYYYNNNQPYYDGDTLILEPNGKRGPSWPQNYNYPYYYQQQPGISPDGSTIYIPGN